MTDTPTPDIVEELDGRCGMRHCEDHPWLGRAADEIERLRDWIRDADHHPGCSGGRSIDGTWDFYRCKCGLTEMRG